jgi:hypothetical protein
MAMLGELLYFVGIFGRRVIGGNGRNVGRVGLEERIELRIGRIFGSRHLDVEYILALCFLPELNGPCSARNAATTLIS